MAQEVSDGEQAKTLFEYLGCAIPDNRLQRSVESRHAHILPFFPQLAWVIEGLWSCGAVEPIGLKERRGGNLSPSTRGIHPRLNF